MTNLTVTQTPLAGVLIITPRVFGDERGFFMESYNSAAFDAAIGEPVAFCQDNHSKSAHNVLRGLHYQTRNPQGKLVRVTRGEVFDVVVDIRRESPSFGKWIGVPLSEANHRQLWIPPGLAHGFYVTSPAAEFQYKVTAPYDPASERSLLWNDPAIGIDWPIAPGATPILSAKDMAGHSFIEFTQ